MRIAVDIRALTDPYVTGIGFYTRYVVEEMIKQAPDDEFLLFASGKPETLNRLPVFKGKNVQTVKVALPNRLLLSLFRLPWGPTLDYFLPQAADVWLFPKFALGRTSHPYVLTVHDLAFELFPQFITRKERMHNRLAKVRHLTQQAARVLAISHSTSSDLQTLWGVPADHITLTPLGVDHDEYRPEEQPSDRTFRAHYKLHQPYILALATHEPRKNFESILEAYAMFRARGGRHLPLVIAGAEGWKTRELNELYAQHPFKHDILSLGYVPDRHKPALYRGAQAFVFPSFYEGFGLPVLEAMACGVPVITSTTSSLPEVTGDAALLIDPFNVNDLAAALHQLLNEPGSAVRQSLIKKGLARAKTFTWEQTAARTLAALKKVATR